ncbi:MAG: nitrate reductase [Verrucomicrobiota bacterium]
MKFPEEHLVRIRAFDGPLTEELLREPGQFGIGQTPTKLPVKASTTMVCGFCSTGCGLSVHLDDEGQAINLSAETSYPVNLGMACPKGWEALSPLDAPDRATNPILRKDGKRVAVDWNTAAEEFCSRFKSILDEHGPESVAWLGTGQITTEELAYLGAFGKFGMGLVHGDGNTRQCMATSVVAYKEAFGFDAPPYTYQDFEESDVIVLVGSNLCIAHPIMWQRVLRNQRNPRIVVIDPRKTETAIAATDHLALRPKSDLTLLYGLANLIIQNQRIDRDFVDAHTKDFADFEAHVSGFDPQRVSEQTGISIQQLREIAELIGDGERVSFWWTMGVNQGHEAVRTAQAIINLALMTGNIGKPGTGANSITGQCNAMGSRLFSNTTNLLGGRDFQNPKHRAEVADVLGIDSSRIPDRLGVAYDQILQRIEDGKIRGLWIIATNPAHSWIHQGRLKGLLDKLDFLVVQDMYDSTETANHADLLLPAAAWGEKDGTFINSERRIGVIKRVSESPGQALADFSIFRLLAHTWGCGEMFEDWDSPENVFQILKKLSRNRPFDFSGVRDYRMIDDEGGIQWPLAENSGEFESQRRLFADGRFYTPDGRARFCFEAPREAPETPDDEFPFVLLTGRATSAQWHTQSRTGKSEVLKKLYPERVYVEIHPEDADDLGVADRQRISVVSRRGKIEASVVVTGCVSPGQVFMPMHYQETNVLTHPSVDPYSRQPNYKACAVRLSVKETDRQVD